MLSVVVGMKASGRWYDGCVVLCGRNGSKWWLVSGLRCPLWQEWKQVVDGVWVVLFCVAGMEASRGRRYGCVVCCGSNRSKWWLVSRLCCLLCQEWKPVVVGVMVVLSCVAGMEASGRW